MRQLLVVGVLFLAAGCEHERRVSLAELAAEGKLDIRLAADGTEVTASLKDATPRGGVGCLVLEGDVRGAVDGEPMERLSRGAYVPPPATDAASGCDLPTFHWTGPVPGTSAASRVVVADDATEVEVGIASMRAVRELMAASEIRPGEDARLAWSVPDDALAPEAGVVWEPDEGDGFALGEAFGASGVAVEDAGLRLSIPADAATGSGQLIFSELATPSVLSCRGIVACVVEPMRPPPLAVAIAP